MNRTKAMWLLSLRHSFGSLLCALLLVMCVAGMAADQRLSVGLRANERAVQVKLEWTVLLPKDFQAASTAAIKRLLDESLLVYGDNPATDSYTVAFAGKHKDVTALRLDAMTDDSLGGNGPGRTPTGNFVLTEFRVALAGKAVKIKAAKADYSQPGHDVITAFDGDAKTGWAVHPQVGKPHFAVFELEQPITIDENNTLTIVLDCQSMFFQHQLGRFKVSAASRKKKDEG